MQRPSIQPGRSAETPPPPPPAQPSREDITRWLKDPANHEAVMSVLRRENRINPSWLPGIVRKGARAHGSPHLRP